MPEQDPAKPSLFVVPDANMLIHCKPLNEMPWSELGRDEIEIVYVSSVIREIDNLKIQNRPSEQVRPSGKRRNPRAPSRGATGPSFHGFRLDD